MELEEGQEGGSVDQIGDEGDSSSVEGSKGRWELLEIEALGEPAPAPSGSSAEQSTGLSQGCSPQAMDRPWLRPASAHHTRADLISGSAARPGSARMARPCSARRRGGNLSKGKDSVTISGRRILSAFKRRAELKFGYDAAAQR